MPISKEFRKYYGWHWRTVTRPKILAREGGVCLRCGRCPRRLEVAHLDQHPPNDADENLAALCPRCHRKADYTVWARKARATRAARKDARRPLLGDL